MAQHKRKIIALVTEDSLKLK